MKKLLLCLLTLLFTLSNAQKIPFILLPSGHIVIKAKVEGVEGNFIFDTGSGLNVFFSDFVSKFPNNPSSNNFFTGFRATGERLDMPIFKSKEIVFANTTFNDMPFSTVDMKVPGVDGLISLKMFENINILIDYNKQEIELMSYIPKSTKFIEIFTSTQADDTIDIFTKVVLNNKISIKVMLDSGAGKDSFWFSSKLINILNIRQESLDSFEKRSEINQGIKTKFYKGKLETISNKYSTVTNPNVLFVDNLIYEGKTGLNWLGNRLVFSLKNKKIYLLD